MNLDREGARRSRAAHDLFIQGRNAVKDGERERARRLLLQAVEYDRNHSQAWLWLSATTDDPAEQKNYLEWAIAADPTNAAARRGLGLLTGQIKEEDLLPEGQGAAPPPEPAEADAQVQQTFTCPQCGGALRFEPGAADLRCQHCGHTVEVEAVPAANADQVLDFALPTVQGHRWAFAERRVTCEQCGGGTVLPAGRTTTECPFCGAAALVAAPDEEELLPLQALIPMAYDQAAAEKAFQAWLGRGFFNPDDLGQVARGHRLRPVYVPFWCFDLTITARWKAQVQETEGTKQRWVWRTGERTLFYTNHLEPGLDTLPAEQLRAALPFDLKQLVEPQAGYLAGWPAGTYNISLAQASLNAREAIVRDARKKLQTRAVPGHAVTNLEVTSSDFTGQTYKLVLLPVWVGHYQYQGQKYPIIVNGQTGKVAGKKPIDWIKVALTSLAVFVAVVPLVALVIFLLAQ